MLIQKSLLNEWMKKVERGDSNSIYYTIKILVSSPLTHMF